MIKETLLALTFLSPALAAQSFNIDIGSALATPPATYAAAGLPGTWNNIQAPHTTPALGPQAFDELLVDLDGNATAVGVHQFGGLALTQADDPAVTGADAALLEDGLITHNASLDSCLYINGLQAGTYEVITYAWLPNAPSVLAKVKLDTVAGIELSGGTWGARHIEGLTYTRQHVTIFSGFMGPHIGIAAGGDTLLGAVVCGLQLRLLDSDSLGVNYCQSTLNSTDIAGIVSANGSATIADDDLNLWARYLPANRFGYFLMADSQGFIPQFGNSQGNLCLGSPLVRFANAITSSGPSGEILFSPALNQLPQGTVFQSGETWSFQLWVRDINPGSTSNTTNGLEITFL